MIATRVFLEYEGQLVELPAGECSAGRGTECTIRFNDPTISRVHLQLNAQHGTLIARDPGSTNGTWINDEPLRGERQLVDGDIVHIGRRRIRLRIGNPDDWGETDQTITSREVESVETPAPILRTPSDLWISEVESRKSPHELATPARDLPAVRLAEDMDVYAEASTIRLRPCPRCHLPTTVHQPVCPKCGFSWSRVSPRSPTEPVTVLQGDRRADVRWRVRLPVSYSSDALTVRAMIRDLSPRGAYVISDLLDPEGTPCELIIIPDGKRQMAFEGVVRHVVNAATGRGGRPPGMGIKFTNRSEQAKEWLDDLLSTLEQTGAVKEVVE